MTNTLPTRRSSELVENDGLVHGPDVPGPQFRGAGPAGHCAADIGPAGGIGENSCPARQWRCGVMAVYWAARAADHRPLSPFFGPAGQIGRASCRERVCKYV